MMLKSARKTLIGLGIISAASVLSGLSWIHYTEPSFDTAKQTFREESTHAQQLAANKVEAALKSIYENLRTLAALPSVRNISRHGENFSEEARVTFQQVYNNLASNIRVSEVYVLPAGFDPQKIDPVTKEPEAPILMFDEFIVNAGANNPNLPKQEEAPDPADMLPEDEAYEYELLKIKLEWLQKNYPQVNAANAMDVPIISGPDVITCDNTDFAKTRNDADRTGVMFSVPFYGTDGKFKGSVTAIILNNALREFLPKSDFALINPTHGYVNLAQNSDLMAASEAFIRGAKPDPALAFSQAVPITMQDPQSQWYVWAGHADTLYLNSEAYQAAKRFRQYGIGVIALLGLFASAFWLQVQRNLRRYLNSAAIAAIARTREEGASQQIARVKTALETATSAFMLVDPKGTVVTLNAAARAIFENATADLRKSLPGFDSAELVGSSIEMFDRELPAQLNVPDVRQLALSDRHFKSVLTPVVTDSGEHIATTIEWQDLTAQIETEKQIDAIVRAASHGDFTRRIDLSHKSGFLLDLSRSVNDLTATMDNGLNEAVRVMSGLAQGDLSQRFTGKFRGSFEKLQNDANAMAESVSRVVRGIATVSEKVDETTRKLAAGMDNLSSRSEQNASSLEETSAQIEEFSTALLQSAAHAGKANTLAATVSNSAASGTNVAASAIDAVTRIQESSQRIGEIVGLIQEIAFQTNILSLNAAVEAARAGEAGRGFAVVATEVRALAQRTASASKDIKALVLNTEGQVRGGVELVTLAGTSLSEIVTSVKHVAGYVSEIAKTTSEQSSGIKQVSSAVSDMEKLTQQNAALVAETDAALQRARGHVQELQEAIAFFKLGDDTEKKLQSFG